MTTDNRYELVSGLYGSGTIVCWYLTVAACLLSWTLHPTKRRSGSIDADFIVLLTFPAVAAAHLISQGHTYPVDQNHSTAEERIRTLQLNAAIEASLNVIETSMAICVILFLLAASFRCLGRAMIVAVIGLFCFAAEGYLYFSNPAIRQAYGTLSRSFLVDFTALLILILTILALLIIFAICLVIMYYSTGRNPNQATGVDPEVVRASQGQGTCFEDSRHVRISTFASLFFLPVAFVTSLIPISIDILSIRTLDVIPWLREAWQRLLEDLFPRTNLSIKDLDQAVAVLAGTTVLGFSLYSAADAQYKK